MKKKLLIAAGAALAAFLLLAVLLWPREYSPADPRGYIPFRWIPVEQYTDGVGEFHTEAGLWDFRLLQKYNIHAQDIDAYWMDGVTQDELDQWNNAAIYDFLRRISDGKRAMLRTMTYNNEGNVIIDAALIEVRAYPRKDGTAFFVREDHRRCTDSCHRDKVQEDERTTFQARAALRRTGTGSGDMEPVRYLIKFPLWLRLEYRTGYDAAMDAEMARLILALSAAGTIEYTEELWTYHSSRYLKGADNVQKIN